MKNNVASNKDPRPVDGAAELMGSYEKKRKNNCSDK